MRALPRYLRMLLPKLKIQQGNYAVRPPNQTLLVWHVQVRRRRRFLSLTLADASAVQHIQNFPSSRILRSFAGRGGGDRVVKRPCANSKVSSPGFLASVVALIPYPQWQVALLAITERRRTSSNDAPRVERTRIGPHKTFNTSRSTISRFITIAHSSSSTHLSRRRRARRASYLFLFDLSSAKYLCY